MKFTVISKDWKDNWGSFSEQIERIKTHGLPFSQEVSGDDIGVDSDFLVFTENEELLSEAGDLIQVAFIDIANIDSRDTFDEDEWNLIEPLMLLKSYEEEVNDGIAYVTLHLKNEKKRIFVGIPWE